MKKHVVAFSGIFDCATYETHKLVSFFSLFLHLGMRVGAFFTHLPIYLLKCG
ncbi:hypothetical protein EHLJMEHL_00954 [Vreelandella titanicae]